MIDNRCLKLLLNNRKLTTLDISAILNCNYATALKKIRTLRFSVQEGNVIAKVMNISLGDLAEIMEGNKEVLKNNLK